MFEYFGRSIHIQKKKIISLHCFCSVPSTLDVSSKMFLLFPSLHKKYKQLTMETFLQAFLNFLQAQTPNSSTKWMQKFYIFYSKSHKSIFGFAIQLNQKNNSWPQFKCHYYY